MKYFNRVLVFVFTLIVVLFSSPIPTHALYIENGNSVIIPQNKKIDESALIAGSDLIIDADINGDLFCAGQNITVNGKIKGDVLCAGQVITINGLVDGNVRVVGQTVEINGNVNRNIISLSQSLRVAKFSLVKGDVFFGVQNVGFEGSLGRDLLGAAEELTISGSLLRNAKVTASKINLIDSAKIGGDFEYYTDNLGTSSISAKNVKGNILKHEIERKEISKNDVNKVSFLGNIFSKVFWIISTLLLGFALIYFLKPGLVSRVGIISHSPFVTGLVGLAVLILTPIVFFLLLVTFIGAPFAFVLLLEYIVSVMLASVYPSIVFGKWILRDLFKKKTEGFYRPLITGTVSLGLIMAIPFIGFITGFILLCLGLGATFLSYLPHYSGRGTQN